MVMVCPSAVAVAPAMWPTAPLPPGRFPRGPGWPSSFWGRIATMRAIRSVPPPAAHGQMSWMGREGYFACAAASEATPAARATTARHAKTIRRTFMRVPPADDGTVTWGRADPSNCRAFSRTLPRNPGGRLCYLRLMGRLYLVADKAEIDSRRARVDTGVVVEVWQDLPTPDIVWMGGDRTRPAAHRHPREAPPSGLFWLGEDAKQAPDAPPAPPPPPPPLVADPAPSLHHPP